MKKKKNALTADSLKESLWETLQAVREKRMEPVQANAVATSAREIMRIVRTEIDLARMTGTKPVNLLGMTPAKKQLRGVN